MVVLFSYTFSKKINSILKFAVFLNKKFYVLFINNFYWTGN
jgi:hypothetical protein